jgi:hypothetical protein
MVNTLLAETERVRSGTAVPGITIDHCLGFYAAPVLSTSIGALGFIDALYMA